MSLSQIMTSLQKCKPLYRKYVVRAVEDAIILGLICLAIAFVCALFTLLFRWMGVS